MKRVSLKIIKFYQIFISPHFRFHCKFYPSCSEYFCEAVEKYGILKGYWKGIGRILRCNPFNRGGIDIP